MHGRVGAKMRASVPPAGGGCWQGPCSFRSAHGCCSAELHQLQGANIGHEPSHFPAPGKPTQPSQVPLANILGKPEAGVGETKWQRHPDDVLFLIGRGGGGHKAAAVAIRDCLIQKQVPWSTNIELIDIGEVVEEAIHGCCAKCCCSGDDIYNELMKRGCYIFAGWSGAVAKHTIGNNRKRIMRHFSELWADREPSLVVSFVPFLNALMRNSLLKACPGSQLVTVVTDMESSDAHPWIDPPDDAAEIHTIVAGNKTLEEQAKSLGYAHILRTSGMVVHPAFYRQEEAPLHIGDSEAGFAQSVLIFFGGFAPMRVEQIAMNALASSLDLHIVVVCGGNDELARRLRKAVGVKSLADRCAVEGFIPAERLRQYMKNCAAVLGKPGPGVTAEAAVCRVPFVTERARVMPQEVCVLKWLEHCGTALVVDNLEKLPADLFQSLHACREAFSKLESNNAVFEISAHLEKMLSDRPA